MARGPKEAARRNAELLAARARRMTNLQQPALSTVREIEAHVATAYATQADPYGGPWPALKYREEPPPKLRLTDESRKDIKVGAFRGNLRLNAMDRIWYQAGGIPSANVPARSMIPFLWNGTTWKAHPRLAANHAKRIAEWIEHGRVTT